MLNRIAAYLSLQLIDNKIIQAEEKETYVFGIKMLFTQTAHALLILILGYFFGLFYESIVFLITYMPLRIYAGGYHASSNTRCFISSTFMIAIVLLTLKSVPEHLALPVSWALGFISLAVILYYAPVENAKKPLDDKEKTVYRNKAYGIAAFIILSMAGCFAFGHVSFGFTLALSIFCECVLILVEICPKRTKAL